MHHPVRTERPRCGFHAKWEAEQGVSGLIEREMTVFAHSRFPEALISAA